MSTSEVCAEATARDLYAEEAHNLPSRQEPFPRFLFLHRTGSFDCRTKAFVLDKSALPEKLDANWI